MRQKKRRHKINRCVLEPTIEQLYGPYRAFWGVIRQHMAFADPLNVDGPLFHLDVNGVLEILWMRFASKDVQQAVVESMHGRVFALKASETTSNIGRALHVQGFIYSVWGTSRKRAKRDQFHKYWRKIERRYLRWVRRNY